MQRVGAARPRAGQPGAEHGEQLDVVVLRQHVVDAGDHGVAGGPGGGKSK